MELVVGLVHKTQISKAKVEHPEEVLDLGEDVWVKVITMEVSRSDCKSKHDSLELTERNSDGTATELLQ